MLHLILICLSWKLRAKVSWETKTFVMNSPKFRFSAIWGCNEAKRQGGGLVLWIGECNNQLFGGWVGIKNGGKVQMSNLLGELRKHYATIIMATWRYMEMNWDAFPGVMFITKRKNKPIKLENNSYLIFPILLWLFWSIYSQAKHFFARIFCSMKCSLLLHQ